MVQGLREKQSAWMLLIRFIIWMFRIDKWRVSGLFAIQALGSIMSGFNVILIMYDNVVRVEASTSDYGDGVDQNIPLTEETASSAYSKINKDEIDRLRQLHGHSAPLARN